MSRLFEGLFGQLGKPKVENLTSALPAVLSQYDSEYITYCIEQEQAISKLESELHTNDDPEVIAKKALAAACEFYGADWAGVIELDLDLSIWTPGWWYNADPKIKELQKFQEFENLVFMPSIVEAINRQKPILISDIDDIQKSSPKEYQVYRRLDVRSVMAVPFGPNPIGFLAVRNNQKYMNRLSTLNTLAYVIHRAIAQKNTMDRVRMALVPDEIKGDKDIIINFFGSLEIVTSTGVWKETNFSSPTSTRAVA